MHTPRLVAEPVLVSRKARDLRCIHGVSLFEPCDECPPGSAGKRPPDTSSPGDVGAMPDEP